MEETETSLKQVEDTVPPAKEVEETEPPSKQVEETETSLKQLEDTVPSAKQVEETESPSKQVEETEPPAEQVEEAGSASTSDLVEVVNPTLDVSVEPPKDISQESITVEHVEKEEIEVKEQIEQTKEDVQTEEKQVEEEKLVDISKSTVPVADMQEDVPPVKEEEPMEVCETREESDSVELTVTETPSADTSEQLNNESEKCEVHELQQTKVSVRPHISRGK